MGKPHNLILVQRKRKNQVNEDMIMDKGISVGSKSKEKESNNVVENSI